MQGIFRVFRQNNMDWLGAEVIASWAAAGLPMTPATEDTREAAGQALVAADTVERALIVELVAANYLRTELPQSVFRFGARADIDDVPLQSFDRVSRSRDADAAGNLVQFVSSIREAINEEWPAVAAEFGYQ